MTGREEVVVGREVALESVALCFAVAFRAMVGGGAGVLDLAREVGFAAIEVPFEDATAVRVPPCAFAFCIGILGWVALDLRVDGTALPLSGLTTRLSSPEEGTSHASKSFVGVAIDFGFGSSFLVGIVRGVGSVSEGTSKSSRGSGNRGEARIVCVCPEAAPGSCAGLESPPACLRGYSGKEGTSSANSCALRERGARPYVTIFLRRSAPVNMEDMEVAITSERCAR